MPLRKRQDQGFFEILNRSLLTVNESLKFQSNAEIGVFFEAQFSPFNNTDCL